MTRLASRVPTPKRGPETIAAARSHGATPSSSMSLLVMQRRYGNAAVTALVQRQADPKRVPMDPRNFTQDEVALVGPAHRKPSGDGAITFRPGNEEEFFGAGKWVEQAGSRSVTLQAPV